MKLMMVHFSYRSCLNISDLFKTMFSDSEIAKSFKLSKTKAAYYAVYGAYYAVYGAYYAVYGLGLWFRFMVYGLWFMV